MEITDAVVVVTGGASGIGAALARKFAAEGARSVVVADLDGKGARDVASEIGGVGVELDVTDEEATADLVASIDADLGGIDILCLNAGVATGGSVDVPNEVWERTWQVNVMAHVYALRHALVGMLDRGHGYVVTTASAAGLLTNLGAAPYAVTKHAAVALAEWISVTYGDRGIGVSCLCPQFVDTPMLDAFAGEEPQMRSWVRDIAIDPDDVAAAVIDGVRAERFLILPHPEVGTYFQRKAGDYDRWIGGMRALQAQLGGEPSVRPER